MRTLMKKLERLPELGETKKDIALLAIGGIALVCSLLKWQPLPFGLAWIAVVLCGVPIVPEAVIGLVTAFDIKADVLVSLALIASVCIGEIFAAGEVAFIMQLGGLLEELTVDKGPGDAVSSGTVNQFGAFEMRATKVGADSSIQRMIRLVQSADAGKAKIVGILIGALILGAGIYYLVKEKADREARKIYTITTVAGAPILTGAIPKLVLAG